MTSSQCSPSVLLPGPLDASSAQEVSVDATCEARPLPGRADEPPPLRALAKAAYVQPRGDGFAQTIPEYKSWKLVFCGDLPRLSQKGQTLHALPDLPIGSKLIKDNGGFF